MDDLIRRQAILDMLEDINNHIIDGYGYKHDWCVEWVKGLPSIDAVQYTNDEIQRMQDIEQAQIQKAYDIGKADAKQQWIPCSERLPDEREERYWCCSEGGYQFQCRWTNDMYGLGANEYSKWGWHVMDKPQYSTVIAWMPLPKPYAEREEEWMI